MSRFPKLTETFILFEMLSLEEQGVEIEIYPLLRAKNTTVHPEGASVWRKLIERLTPSQSPPVMHPDAAPLVERAHFEPFVSWRILRAQFRYLWQKPLTYFKTLGTVLRANWGSINYLLGALAIFPKCAYFAHRMSEEGVTHVHAHFANHPASAAYIIHQLASIPYSFTAHGADLQVDQHMLSEKVADAAVVVTISHYNRDLIVQVCGEHVRDKIAVVHCGVDTTVFHPGTGIHVASNRPLTIVCTGTMYEVKGHPYLIEACRLLKSRGIDFTCRLVGDGPDRQKLEEQVAQADLGAHVRFEGPRTRDEVAEILRDADVVAVPSVPTNNGRREGIPVVLMEAMSSGLPVVASAISGIPELVEHDQTGLLVPPRDPNALADAIEQLHNEPERRRRLGRASRQTVLERFNLHRNAATLAQYFRNGATS